MKDRIENAEKLYGQVIALETYRATLTEDLPKLWLEVRQLLTESENSSQLDGVRNFYRQMGVRQFDNARKSESLYKNLNVVINLFRESKMRSKFDELEKLTKNADLTKAADEYLQAVSNHSLHNLVNNSVPVWQYYIAVSQIASTFVTYQECEVYRAFLNRPSVHAEIMELVAVTAKEVGMDLLGGVIPFVGILGAFFDVARPHIEKELQKFREATAIMDRLFLLDNNLIVLSNYIHSAGMIIEFSDSSIRENEVNFVNEADYLLEIWKGFQK
jgi:hypothetical protein